MLYVILFTLIGLLLTTNIFVANTFTNGFLFLNTLQNANAQELTGSFTVTRDIIVTITNPEITSFSHQEIHMKVSGETGEASTGAFRSIEGQCTIKGDLDGEVYIDKTFSSPGGGFYINSNDTLTFVVAFTDPDQNSAICVTPSEYVEIPYTIENGFIKSSGSANIPIGCNEVVVTCTDQYSWDITIPLSSQQLENCVNGIDDDGDGLVDEQDPDCGITPPPNQPPIANAGSDQQVQSEAFVSLNGLGSSDPDNNPLTYSWSQIGGPTVTFSDPTSPIPTFTAPKVTIDTDLTFQLVVNDGTVDSSPDTVIVKVKPSEFQIDVTADKTQLNPHPIDYRPDPNLKSTITVTVKDLDNNPVPNKQVEIKACTVPSNSPVSNDGHQNHDTSRINECDAGIASTDKPLRPTATLNKVKETNVNPLTLTTDTNGKITIPYVPPKGYNSNTWISGRDHIIASLVSDPSIKDEDTYIETRVPGIQQMTFTPFVDPKLGICGILFDGTTQLIHFIKQEHHDCLFYGTRDTNKNLETIARTYHDRQVACEASRPLFNSPACDVPGKDAQITTIKPLRVTAMSSNWGGLLDIGPAPTNKCSKDPNGTCDLWTSPHSTHGDGKNVDIGFGTTTFILADNNMLLLKDVILDTIERGIPFPNPLPYPDEGGFDFIKANHFHVRFPS